MKKFVDFIKKVGSVLYDLYIASNRWMHAIVGGFIYLVMMAATAIWTPYDVNAWQCIFVATVATFLCMASVEYKDMAHGGDFDWKDIIAGMTPPVLIDLVALVLMIIK